MENSFYKNSLGRELESFVGSLGNCSLNARACRSWDRWLELVRGPRLDEFTSILSVAQFNSHRILLELWNNAPGDRSLLLAFAGAFRDATEQDSNETEAQPAKLSPEEMPRLDGGSEFQKVIFDLFFWEFYFHTDFDDSRVFLSLLHSSRREAALFMACARVSRRTFPHLVEESKRVQAPETSGPSSWKRNSDIAGASIQPCPWIQDMPAGEDMPYHLWDRQLQKTIITSEVDDPPDYIAISHTWGRWKIGDTSMTLPGTEWAIPLNSRFDVGSLPTILGQISLPHRYVWLDLLCIPQNGSDLAKMEISRQATIFRKASVAVMWLNDVIHWSGLKAAVEWFSLQFIDDNEMFENDQTIKNKLNEQEKKLGDSMELAQIPEGGDAATAQNKFNPWFNSLWTLQEICLRPDMVLANRDWELLSMDGVPVTFDEIVALEHARRKFSRPDPDQLAIRQLKSLLTSTGLSGLLVMTRCQILELGSHRFCLERRAEAIMAVIDAKQWFADALSDESREENLVMGLYPLKFVDEVKFKIGSSTFFNSDTVEPYFYNILSQVAARTQSLEPVGSMLPFGKGYPKIFHQVEWDFEVTPHSSVTTWWLHGCSGMVYIPEAVVVSSTERIYEKEMTAIIMAPAMGEITRDLTSTQSVNLHEWIGSYEPKFPNTAVALFSSSTTSIGILLKELAPGVMVKVGTYFADPGDVQIPAAETVNWIVL